LRREIKSPMGTGKVVGLAGVRRAGKTSPFFYAMRLLLEMRVPHERMLYLSFEDDRLQPIREGALDLVSTSYRELYPDSIGEKVYLFLDEVQSVPGWELCAKRLNVAKKPQNLSKFCLVISKDIPDVCFSIINNFFNNIHYSITN